MNMKNVLFVLMSLCFIRCTEIAPIVPPLGDKKVLIEEFTGVRCVNCPAGAAEIDNLKALYGDRLVVVSVHVGDFAPPFSDSRYDFRTTDGTALEQRLGTPLGYPSAVINRKKFAGQTGLQVGRTTWTGFIAAETQAASPVNFIIDKKYNTSTRQFQSTIKFVVNDVKQIENLSFSALITENNIIDTQETPQGKRYDYKHQHVFRGFATDEMPVISKNGTLSDITFSTILNDKWIVENCHITIILHQKGTLEKTILQVSELKILN